MTTFNTSLQNAEFYVVDERTVLRIESLHILQLDGTF